MNQGEVSKSFEENFDSLSISYDSEAPTSAALSAINQVTSMTIVPEEENEISLPPLPDISVLPKAPGISRVYRAW